MIHLDKFALECDLAETYHIYDMHELPLSKVALFSYGLRDNSRIKMKMSGELYPFETLLLAGVLDRLSLLWWSKTPDAQKGIRRPESVLSRLLGVNPKDNREHMTFDTIEAFERMRAQIISKGEGKE
jgi:hypothetical protein